MTPTPPPTDDKLLPCPFCGETAGVLFTPTCDRKTPYNPTDRAFPIVRCASCFAEAHGTDWDQRGKTAIAAWNTRAALRPEPSPDDAAVLDQHESAALQNDNINGCGPLALQMEAEYQRTRAAVLARMDRRAVIAECVAALKTKQKMLIDVGCDGPVVNAFSSAMGVIRALADKEQSNG